MGSVLVIIGVSAFSCPFITSLFVVVCFAGKWPSYSELLIEVVGLIALGIFDCDGKTL
jgi:hypothetical protein